MKDIKNIFRYFRIIIIRIYAQTHSRQVPYSGVSLILAPHPDDEVLGCAGLIQRLLKENKIVHIVILTGGEASHSGCCKINREELMNNRRTLSKKAAEILGIPASSLHYLDYPDGKISFDNPETERLKTLIQSLKPDAIFVPHHYEGWNDHIEAGNIVKRLAKDNINIKLYEYCVWFWYYNSWNLEWENDCMLKMTEEEVRLKNKAIDCYVHPLAPCGKPWSGVLPDLFIWANRWKNELYFKIK
jgi:LmbE family N-acetylglucosaminyl deacetylase